MFISLYFFHCVGNLSPLGHAVITLANIFRAILIAALKALLGMLSKPGALFSAIFIVSSRRVTHIPESYSHFVGKGLLLSRVAS